jgi:hypothetical protein
MKPREKVVTAEDIQSSLYFIHVEQPEDTNLIAPPDFQEPNYTHQPFTSSSPALAPVVPRKAVPGTSMIQAGTGLPGRKPVPGALTPVDNMQNRQNIDAGNYAQKIGMLDPDNPRRSYDPTQYRGEKDRSAFAPRRSYDRSRFAGTTLTLIRRDPASGAQWNVARIEDPPILEVSSSTLIEPGTKKKAGAPMYIEVMNPGYSKFLRSQNPDRPASQSRASDMSTLPHQAVDLSHNQMPPATPDSAALQGQNTFRRRLWMEGTQHGGDFGHRKNNSSDSTSGRPTSRDSYDARLGASRPAPSPAFLTHNDQAYSTIQVSDRPTSFRGYVFTSPWNGRCEFATGAGGGSLKVSNFSLSVYNALTRRSVDMLSQGCKVPLRPPCL